MEPTQWTDNAAIGDSAAAASSSHSDAGGENGFARNVSLRRQNSEGFKRRVGSRREESDHEIIRRRSSRALVSDAPATSSVVQQVAEEPERRPSLSRSVSGERRRSYSAVPENFFRRGSRSSSSSLSLDQVDDRKGKKHTELVERFQIRHLHRSPSDSTTSVSISRESQRERNLERSHSVRSSTGAPSKHADASSTSPTQPVRPLAPITGTVVGVPYSSDVDPRPLNSYRSVQTHRKETTLATSRQYEADIPKSPRLRDRMKHFCWSLAQPMSPLSTSFRARQLVMVAALVVHVINFPLAAAFHYSHTESRIEMAVEAVFVIDFLLMFNTAVFDKRGMLITERGKIARRYISSWFILDMLSSVPVEWILAHGENTQADNTRSQFLYNLICRSPRIIHSIRLIRFAWAVRVDRSERNVLTWLFYSRYSHLLRIAWIIIALVVVAHYMACCWKLLETSSTTSSSVEDYVSSFYDVLQLLQGQGIPTTSLPQNIFAAVATLAGSLLLAVVFGNVGILVSNFNANSTSYQRKMESVFAIMSKLQLPAPLRERIHQYYEHLWREYESLDGEIVAFSKGLSHTLELEVVLFKYMDLIMHVPFWRDGSPDFQKQLMLSLHVRVYLPDDFIIRRGEVGDEFFMINRGICELVLGPDSLETTSEEPLEGGSDGDGSASSNVRSGRSGRGVSSHKEGNSTARNEIFDKVRAPLTARQDGGKTERDRFPQIRVLRRGQTFGELALLMNYERTANVRALSYVEMCVLKRDDVQRIFLKHSKDRKSVITDLLTRAMESNELHNVRCPLKALVQNALSDEDHTRISAMHAALTIASAIDVEHEDDTIRFGIGPSLEQRLRKMIGGRRDPTDERRSFQSFRASERSLGRQDSANEQELSKLDAGRDNSLHQALNRIDSLEATQAQLLQLVRDMHNEVREMRRAYTEVSRQSFQPIPQSKAKRSELSVFTPDTFTDSDTSSRVTPISVDSAVGVHAAAMMTAVEMVSDPPDSNEVAPTEARNLVTKCDHEDCQPKSSSKSPQRRRDIAVTDSCVTPAREADLELAEAPQPTQSSCVVSASCTDRVERNDDRALLTPKVRPQMRGRRASYRDPTIKPARLAPRTSMGKLPELQTLQTTKESSRADESVPDNEQVDHVDELPPARTSVQPQQARHPQQPRLVHRPSLLAPLRNLMAAMTPGSVPSSASASPYADQLFHGRSDHSGRSGRYDHDQPAH